LKRVVWILGMAAVLVGAIAAFAPNTLAAQKGPKSSSTAAKGGTARGEDPNVKKDEGKNTAGSKAAKPTQKGGPKARGASTGVIHVDNRTPWYISISVNGDYAGTVGPYGDLYYYAESGTHLLFGRALFDDGSEKIFGYTTIVLDGTYTWRLIQ
jgi:hypothetical protein